MAAKSSRFFVLVPKFQLEHKNNNFHAALRLAKIGVAGREKTLPNRRSGRISQEFTPMNVKPTAKSRVL